jgi:predicted double-glycine peptidase
MDHHCNNVVMLTYIASPMAAPQLALYASPQSAATATLPANVPNVPFYSQFKDLQSPTWQKVGCGVTSLAMIIDFYKPNAVSADALLKQGIAAGAYQKNAGWKYDGLIALSNEYGLDGNYQDLSKLDMATAFETLKNLAKGGPVIVSVHYKFNPKSAIPHLVVVNGIEHDVVYYNDPAAKTGEKQISVADFLKGWKRRVIVVRPVVASA